MGCTTSAGMEVDSGAHVTYKLQCSFTSFQNWEGGCLLDRSETGYKFHLLTEALLLRGNLREFQTPYMRTADLIITILVTRSPGVAIAVAMPLGSVVSAIGAASAEVEINVATARQMVKAVTSILE